MEDNFETRSQRIQKAIRLEKVDRVPVIPFVDAFAALHAGITLAEWCADGEKAMLAMDRTWIDLGGFDAHYRAASRVSKLARGLLQPLKTLLPGQDLPPDYLWQYLEEPVMTVEDYDRIVDMGYGNWLMQVQMPRLYPNMDREAELSKVPEVVRDQERARNHWREMGIPVLIGGICAMPIDCLSTGRSCAEFLLDVYRHPEKIVKALDVATPEIGQGVIRQAKAAGVPVGFIGGDRGSATYISPRLFEKFTWPYMVQLVNSFVAEGITPLLHLDSNWNPLLSYLRELPKGKCIMHTDGTTDLFKAKEVLGNHTCLMGDVPGTLLVLGAPDEVEQYVTRLIKEVGEGGGFILAQGCTVPPNAKFENVKRMVDVAKEMAGVN